MKTHVKFVGLDVDKDTIVIAEADAGRTGKFASWAPSAPTCPRWSAR